MPPSKTPLSTAEHAKKQAMSKTPPVTERRGTQRRDENLGDRRNEVHASTEAMVDAMVQDGALVDRISGGPTGDRREMDRRGVALAMADALRDILDSESRIPAAKRN